MKTMWAASTLTRAVQPHSAWFLGACPVRQLSIGDSSGHNLYADCDIGSQMQRHAEKRQDRNHARNSGCRRCYIYCGRYLGAANDVGVRNDLPLLSGLNTTCIRIAACCGVCRARVSLLSCLVLYVVCMYSCTLVLCMYKIWSMGYLLCVLGRHAAACRT